MGKGDDLTGEKREHGEELSCDDSPDATVFVNMVLYRVRRKRRFEVCFFTLKFRPARSMMYL
jgi:hypothetical protein